MACNMSWSMRLEIAAPYRQEELYRLWIKFKDAPHADKILADFMGSDDTSAAQRLIIGFERRYRLEHGSKNNSDEE